MSIDGSGWGPGRRTRRALDGMPQNGRYRDLGGKPPSKPPGGDGCVVTLLGLVGAGWVLDLLLAGSRAVT